MESQWDLALVAGAAFVAVMVLVYLANRRRRHLEALLNDFIQRQVLWVRRKKKAAELKLNQRENPSTKEPSSH